VSLARRDFVAHASLTLIAGLTGRSAFARQPAAPTPVFTPIRRNVGVFTANGGAVGKSREEILAIRTPVPKFDTHGPLTEAVLTAAHDELVG